MATISRCIWPLLFFAAFLPFSGNAQKQESITAIWRPMSFSSEFKLGGHYRYQEGFSNDIYNYQKNPQVYGGVAITSNSYFWHPNFMVLDIGAEYNPIMNQEKYLVVPDQSEVNTIKKLDASATFFKQKPINLRVFANINECYTNRENLSNLKLNSTNWGGVLNFSNKILPVQVSYRDGTWTEKEISSGRVYNMHQKNLQAEANKCFSSLDRNELRLSHNNYFRQDDNFPPINNISDNFDLINRVDFNKTRNYTFHSNISGINQKGNDAFSRIQANESLTLKLPYKFTVSGNYDYYLNQRATQKSIQNNVYGAIGYKLYESLTARAYFEDNSLNHTLYQENNHKLGMEVGYIKKIPTGHFSLHYESFKQNQKRVSDVTILEVYNEEHLLADGLIVLLNKTFIYENSVVVKDVTGTIIYKANLDYILIKRNNLIEIQRVPGGQIANSSPVFIDYSFLPSGSYQFNANYRQFSAGVVILDNLIELYFKVAKQDYNNVVSTDALTLNYFTQTIYGGRLEYKFASGGAEYEYYKSSLIPYRQFRYFLVLQGTFKDKFVFSFNGNVRNYHMLTDDTKQKYIDLSGIVTYNIATQTRLNVEFGYRKQLGQGIALDLITGKADISTIYRQVSCKVGVQVYRRIYLNEKTNFIGGYVEIVRRFNWHRR